jgi:hypothetical protein
MNHRMTPEAKFTGLTLTMPQQRPWRPFVLALGLAFAQPGVGGAAEPATPASVGVYAKHVGGKIAYYYRVTNRSPLDITAVSIGYDTRNDNDPGNDIWELSELPSGWNPKLGVPSATSNSPTGWRVSMTIPGDMPPSAEDIKAHAITWEIINKKSPVLYSGQTLAKMSITLDKADNSYMTSHALVTFAGGSAGAPAKDAPAPATKAPPFNVSVPVERLDVRPPALAVALSPATIWPADNKLVPVSATFPVKEDEFDNLPEIRLESVTANEPLDPDDVRDASYGLDDRYLRLRAKRNGSTDRIYTVTYSATDASGNQAIATATVTVPANAPAVITPAPAMPVQASATAPPAAKAPTAPGATAPHDPGKKGKTEAR